jgi:hypothetical protein
MQGEDQQHGMCPSGWPAERKPMIGCQSGRLRAYSQRTSGKCASTGSLYSSRVLNTPLNVGRVPGAFSSADCICRSPSVSHAFTNVLLAFSPSPNKLDTAVSDRGSGWASPGGSSRTLRANASRENPWVRTKGSANFSSFEELAIYSVPTLNIYPLNIPCHRRRCRVRTRRKLPSNRRV